MVNVIIDELTPCLKDTLTGEIVQTEVIELTRASFLKKFNKQTQWYVSWDKLLKENRVYALVLAGTFDIQGLVALREDKDMACMFISWMVAAPHNNPQITKQKKYLGVGGHLFAIASEKSVEAGYDGVVSGFASDQKLLEHYVEKLHAEAICMLHEFQFMVDEEASQQIREEYTYEWTNEKL